MSVPILSVAATLAMFLCGLFPVQSAVAGSNAHTESEAYLAGDYATARIGWLELATGGDAVASFNLAMLYLQGLGVPKEKVRATQYLYSAAIKGYAPAQFHYAMEMRSERLRPDSAGEMLFWLETAARQGHPLAMFWMGRLLAEGDIVEKNEGQALNWLKKAENAGIKESVALKGKLEISLPGSLDEDDAMLTARLKEGRGTLKQRRQFFEGQKAFIVQDYQTAVDTWSPLAQAGMARAQYGIAFMLESGWGVVQDYDEAAYWYKLAAQKGHRKAQFNLGKMYLDSRVSEGSRGIGLYWIQTAADLGEPRARDYMVKLQETNG